MSTHSQVVTSLHLWTDGDPKAGISGETAEVTAPGWLLNAADTDPIHTESCWRPSRQRSSRHSA